MVFNSFRLNIFARVIIIIITSFLLAIAFYNKNYFIAGFLLFLIIIQSVFLIKFVEKTNRDLSHFFDSIKFSDFTTTFSSKGYGSSFKDLHKSFRNVIDQFLETRSEMEENFQYLQTVVKHIKIGLISFSNNGDITLINNAAKELFKVNEIKNINQLKVFSPELLNILSDISSGKKHLLKIEIDDKPLQLSVFGIEFKMRGKKFFLVSLQDITPELERERLSSELEIARKVQIDLLPKTIPSVKGFSINAQCTPATEIGGDYYDFIEVSEGKIGFVIADVAGKGLPAAIYMTLTKGIFQSIAINQNSAKDVLIKLNSLIYNNIKRGSFITMFYAILDYRNHTLTYSRAGHEPVIFFNKNENNYRILKPAGIGLGLEKDSLFSSSIKEETINLKSGDNLLFYTDGVTDSKNNSFEDFGFDNLLKVIRNSDHCPDNLIELINKEISSFRNHSPQYDDITLIALQKE